MATHRTTWFAPETRTPWSARDVFCNFPFDARYESLYLALIASICCTGLQPRTVVEIPPSRGRVARILDLLSACQWSIHDLSRVELSGGVPRFNMPFELGLAVGLAWREPRRHQFRLLETRPFRVQRSLSDLNGFDPLIHHGTVGGMFDAISDMFSASSQRFPIADQAQFHHVYRALRAFRRQQFGRASLYTPTRYRELVTAARTYVKVFAH